MPCVHLLILRLPAGYFVLCSVPEGVRKDRIRVIRRDKRTPGGSGREKSSKDVQQKTAPPQDRRKQHSNSGTGGAAGKTSVPGIPPEQVPVILLFQNDPVQIVRKPKVTILAVILVANVLIGLNCCFARYSSSSRGPSPRCCAPARS